MSTPHLTWILIRFNEVRDQSMYMATHSGRNSNVVGRPHENALALLPCSDACVKVSTTCRKQPCASVKVHDLQETALRMCQGEHELQETALRSESQLESTRRSLMELDEDKQAGKEETESARWAFIPL